MFQAPAHLAIHPAIHPSITTPPRMNPKHTWIRVAVAAALFAFIFFFERHLREPPSGPVRILPSFNPAVVTGMQIQPANQMPIRIQRTNGVWRLTEPVAYPASVAGVETLLRSLENLVQVFFISPAELKDHVKANEEYGFNPPLVSLTLEQGREENRVWIGARTPPGNQVYLQVVGREGIYVVDAELLRRIPLTANGWRDPGLVDLGRLQFDGLVVTNAGKVLDLQRNPTNGLWRMIEPNRTRADTLKVEEALLRLQNLRVGQFVSDDPRADLDAFGLRTPELSLAFKQGTNAVLLLNFGLSPANDPGQLYARRGNSSSVVTVSRDALEAWRASHDFRDFLDRHLVAFAGPPDIIEIHAGDRFSLERQTNGAWRVQPQNLPGFPADAALVSEVISNLATLQVIEFVKDVVPEQDLAAYGLDTPVRRCILKSSGSGDNPTNQVIAQLDFGVKDGKVFARRAGEHFVYAVNPSDLDRLPWASWQMRDRRIWSFTEDEAVRLTIRQGGRTRELIRSGTNRWSFAPGSQGILDEVEMAKVEEAVHSLGDLSAAAWVERGDENRAGYGFEPEGWQIAVELKDGRKFSVEFGGPTASGLPCALTMLDGQPWIFEFPLHTFRYVGAYLVIPASQP
jgi:hypothetical protein